VTFAVPFFAARKRTTMSPEAPVGPLMLSRWRIAPTLRTLELLELTVVLVVGGLALRAQLIWTTSPTRASTLVSWSLLPLITWMLVAFTPLIWGVLAGGVLFFAPVFPFLFWTWGMVGARGPQRASAKLPATTSDFIIFIWIYLSRNAFGVWLHRFNRGTTPLLPAQRSRPCQSI